MLQSLTSVPLLHSERAVPAGEIGQPLMSAPATAAASVVVAAGRRFSEPHFSHLDVSRVGALVAASAQIAASDASAAHYQQQQQQQQQRALQFGLSAALQDTGDDSSDDEQAVVSVSSEGLLDSALWRVAEQGEMCEATGGCAYKDVGSGLSSCKHYHAACSHVHKCRARAGMNYHHHLLSKVRSCNCQA
jgi:hypothetical protein